MASDQLRKKWGTIFMGEREASPQQLDAMQEPLLRERAQQQHQEDYLARVRARAEERAREILGAAYAERQKVLEEAAAEAQTRIQQLTREAQALRAQAQQELEQAEAEQGKARDLREEAEIIRDHAHNDGFQAGMAQAGAELKEFRADVGQMLGNMLQALEAQRHALGEAWRDELAELARVAVEAGTGWILQAEHARILQHLVFSSLQLLEDRATVSVRVHPDDEETVSDLFRAARERVPELSQWIVNGDASIEAGGLVAESVSGSVENLRAHYREMVNGILEHLTLPQRPQDGQAEQNASAAAAQGLAHLAEIMPQEQAPAAEVPATLPPEAEMEAEAEPGLPADAAPELSSELSPELAPELAPGLSPEIAGGAGADAPIAAGLAPDGHAAPEYSAVQDGLADPGQQPQELFEPVESAQSGAMPEQADLPDQAELPELADQFFDATAVPPHDSPSAPEEVSAAAQPFEPAPSAAPEPQPAASAAQVQAHEAPAANPSLAELEDELFPLPAEEQDHQSQPDSSVFVSGGFLPGSGNG